MKRGTLKSFREYLNAKFAGEKAHQHGRYQQLSRPYGDYLYFQDRAKFNVELQDALDGLEYKDWSRP